MDVKIEPSDPKRGSSRVDTKITPIMIDALDKLRTFVRSVHAEQYPHQIDVDTAQAIELLDIKGYFNTIDKARTETP